MAEVSPSFAKYQSGRSGAATGCLGDFFSGSISLGLSAALLSDGLPAQILQTAILLAEEILLFWVTWQMASGIRDMEYHYGTWMNAEDVTVAWKLMVGIYAAGFVFSRLAVLLMAPLKSCCHAFPLSFWSSEMSPSIFSFWYSSTRRRRPTICCRDEWAWENEMTVEDVKIMPEVGNDACDYL